MAKANLLILKKSLIPVPASSTGYVNSDRQGRSLLENNSLFRYWLPTKELSQPLIYKKFNLNNFRCKYISNKPTNLKNVFRNFKMTMYSKSSYSIYRTRKDYYDKLKISSLLYFKKLSTNCHLSTHRTSVSDKRKSQSGYTLHPYFINFEPKLQQKSWIWSGTPKSRYYQQTDPEPWVNTNDYGPNPEMTSLISNKFFTLYDNYKKVTYSKNIQSTYTLFDLLLSKADTTSLSNDDERGAYGSLAYQVYLQPLTNTYAKAKRLFYYRELKTMTRNLYRLCGQWSTTRVRFHHFSYPSLALLATLSLVTRKQVLEEIRGIKPQTSIELDSDHGAVDLKYEALPERLYRTRLLILATRTFLYKDSCVECKSRFYYLNLASQFYLDSEAGEDSNFTVKTRELVSMPETITFKYLAFKNVTVSQLRSPNNPLNKLISKYLVLYLYTFGSLNQLVNNSTATYNPSSETRFKNLVGKRFRRFAQEPFLWKFFQKRSGVVQTKDVFYDDSICLDSYDGGAIYTTRMLRKRQSLSRRIKVGVRKISYGRVKLVLEQFITRLKISQPQMSKYYRRTLLRSLHIPLPHTLTQQLPDVWNVVTLESTDLDISSMFFFYTLRRYFLYVSSTDIETRLLGYGQTSSELSTKVARLLLQTNKARNLLTSKPRTWYQNCGSRQLRVSSNNSTLSSNYTHLANFNNSVPESTSATYKPTPQNLINDSNQSLIWFTNLATRFVSLLPIVLRINPSTLGVQRNYKLPVVDLLLEKNTEEWSIIKQLTALFRFQLDHSSISSSPVYTNKHHVRSRLRFTTSTGLAFVLNTSSFYYVFLTTTKHYSPLEALRRYRITIYSFSDDIIVKKGIIKRYTKRSDYDLNLGRLTDMYQTFGFSMNATSVLATAPWNYSLNYFPIESLFDKSEYIPKSQRIRFKPGYSRIWRRVRTAFKVVFFLKFRYQHRLTTYVMKNELSQTNSLSTPVNKIVNQENLVFILLMRCKFATDYVWSFELIQNNYVFINGFTVTNPNTSLIKGDFLQLLVHVKYYITLKWQKSLVFDKKVRLFKFVKRKFKPKTQRMGADRNYRYPDWLLKLRFYSGSVPRIFELDFFTLSGFMIHNPFMATYFDTDERDLPWPKVLRLYNWKYIN